MTNVTKCPKCRGRMLVYNVRPNEYGELVRWRKCEDCGYRFVTAEIIDHEIKEGGGKNG